MGDLHKVERSFFKVITLGLSENLHGGSTAGKPANPRKLAPAGTPPAAMTKEQRTARAKLSARYAAGELPKASKILEPEKPRNGASSILGG